MDTLERGAGEGLLRDMGSCSLSSGRSTPTGAHVSAVVSRRELLRRAVAAPLAAALLGDGPDDFALQQIAPGSFAHFGQVAMTSPRNAGDIANLGLVVGTEAAAVIDTGGSVAVGRRLLAALRGVTDRPVRYVINTHEHPDHVFGNAAFLGTGARGSDPIFVGHRNLARSLAERGVYYLRSFSDALGADAIAEVRIIPPSLAVDTETLLDLGGRQLRLTAWDEPAHSDCDLSLLDLSADLLYAGDLLFVRHVPVLDGSIKGWLSLLPRLAQSHATRAVPGHGPAPVPWPDALADETRYLETLARDARAAIARGTDLAQAVPGIAASERGRWELFDEYNPRNATAAFSELEWE